MSGHGILKDFVVNTEDISDWFPSFLSAGLTLIYIDLKLIFPFFFCFLKGSMLLHEKAHSIAGQPQNKQMKEKHPLENLE